MRAGPTHDHESLKKGAGPARECEGLEREQAQRMIVRARKRFGTAHDREGLERELKGLTLEQQDGEPMDT